MKTVRKLAWPVIGLAAIVALVLVGAGAMRAVGSGPRAPAAERGTAELLTGTGADTAALRAARDEAEGDPADATARVLRAWLADS